jgi:hypothetical protein
MQAQQGGIGRKINLGQKASGKTLRVLISTWPVSK